MFILCSIELMQVTSIMGANSWSRVIAPNLAHVSSSAPKERNAWKIGPRYSPDP